MIVWAGNDNSFASVNTGGRYSPGADSWTPTTTTNAPINRSLNTAVWTGSEMIVWGGVRPGGYLDSGGRYCAQSPGTPTPSPTPPLATPTPTPTVPPGTPTPTPTPPPPTATPTSSPTTFGFVPGHYYTSNYSSRVITEYDGFGTVVASYTVPSTLGQEVKGLAFSPDGLLYAAVSYGFSGFTVLALRSDGSVAASYEGTGSIAANLSHGKIAMDNQYLYVSGSGQLTRFRLGDPSSGTTIYGGSMSRCKAAA